MAADFSRRVYIGFVVTTLTGVLQMLVVWVCFEINLGSLLFRCILGNAMSVIATFMVRYLFVMMWFPKLPEEQFLLYLLLLVTVYTLVYGISYLFIIRKMQTGDNGKSMVTGRRSTTWVYLSIFIAFSVIVSLIMTLCESLLQPLTSYSDLGAVYRVIQYFCIAVLISLSALLMILFSHIYEVGVLQNERNLFDQLLREKKQQYEFIKENTDLINRKCHELKNQLRALELAGEEERNRMILQVRNAINFYDATVNTGNEVLDTILTEKSVLCANRGIKLTCMANVGDLAHVKVVDLYTMLDYALGNAIESAIELSDKDKKLISFMLTTVGEMLYISVENYYDGKIKMKGGYPVNGYRFKNIRRLAKQYGGDIRINNENQIFQIQIILPA